MKAILGKKIGMTQIWDQDKMIGVSMVKAGPCFVSQLKGEEKNGYTALQIGFGEKKEKNIRKPQLGHYKKAKEVIGDKANFQHLKEVKNKNIDGVEIGDMIDLESFAVGEKVTISGHSKGRGFQGVVKRHGFAGALKTHGHKDQERMPGSIGAKGVARVFKGVRMGGRMGNEAITTKNLRVVQIDLENNILFIEGPVPGAKDSLVFISGEGDMKFKKFNTASEEKVETVVEENIEEVVAEIPEMPEVIETPEAVEVKEEITTPEVVENTEEVTAEAPVIAEAEVVENKEESNEEAK